MLNKIQNKFTSLCQTIGCAWNAPTQGQIKFMLYTVGVGLLTAGLVAQASAAGAVSGNTGINVVYDGRLRNAIAVIFQYLEGALGALIMIACGLGAIVSAAIGQYRAALGLMVVAVGAFILRNLTATFFPAAFDAPGVSGVHADAGGVGTNGLQI